MSGEPGGSALNLDAHLHMLMLDGVYRPDGEGGLWFVPVPGRNFSVGVRATFRVIGE